MFIHFRVPDLDIVCFMLQISTCLQFLVNILDIPFPFESLKALGAPPNLQSPGIPGIWK